ncbi:MAG: type II secretion system F family protein [Candidatus Rokubacteria bacterium]|nr:type II secretion system F family protein [Candidatus Rokubacteria bacterium]
MPVFEYEVADRRGSLSRGRAEAVDQRDLIGRFRDRGQIVLSIRAASAGGVGDASNLSGRIQSLRHSLTAARSSVGLSTLVLFTGQLAAMLAGGLHLVRILNALGAEATSRRFRAIVEDVRDSVTAGTSFADSLGRHPQVFNPLYQAVVRAGEASGSLPMVLDTLTVHLEKVAALRRKVRGAIAYPAVILSVALVIVFIMIVKIVPVFEGVYARANVQLPAATRILVSVSGAIREYTTLVGLAVVLLAILAYALARGERGRLLVDRVKLSLPVFGPLIRKAAMARTCRTLAVLLSAGIPLVEAMETVSRVTGNRVLEDALATATRRMRDGGTIADTLRQTGEFPSMVTQLVATGEESGTLPAMLTRAASYYEQLVDSAVSTLSTLIEPIMIVIMGAIVAGVIFALYLPIFSLGQAFKGAAFQ